MKPKNLSKEAFASYQKAGEIASQALHYGATLVKPGVLVREALDSIESRIIELGGKLAFPAQSAIDACAAHYCPDDTDETTYEAGQLVKLDCGVHINGYIADTALTLDLGNKWSHLIEASEEALQAAIELAKPGVLPSKIGRAIEQKIKQYDLQPMRNLRGHGIDRYCLHAGVSIPNIYCEEKEDPLEEGQVIAIEPFVTNGFGSARSNGDATLYEIKQERPVLDILTNQVLQRIKSYSGLPFTKRWLTREFGPGQALAALRELEFSQVIAAIPPFIEQERGMVAQAEHTVIVGDPPIVTTIKSD